MRPVCIAVLALGACQAAPPHAQTPQQFCASVANRDPAVKDLIVKAASNGYVETQIQGDIRAARARAATACLRRQGIGPVGGGVEAPARSSDTLFQHN